MNYLEKNEAERIITAEEFKIIGSIIELQRLAIRCNNGKDYTGGDGFNLETDNYDNFIKYATALYASICFAQDTIQEKIDEYFLLLMKDCALKTGETYTYRQGDKSYETLPKCHGLGGDATVVYCWNMNDSAITMSRRVVEQILSL